MGFMGYVILTAFALGAVGILVLVLAMRRQPRHTGKGRHPHGGHPKAPGDPGSSTLEPDDRETALAQNAQVIRSVLLDLASAIQRLDGATDKSTSNLSSVRDSVRGMKLPQDITDCQRLILSELDKVIGTNHTLRTELESAKADLAEQHRQIESLQMAARVDGLTQVANRAYFDEYLAGALRHFQRYKEPFSLMLVDIDHFKSINDTHGHQAGDRILRAMTKKMKAAVRGSDFVARYGGEEFAVVLIRADLAVALQVAESVRDSVETTAFRLEATTLRVTVSVGVAEVLAGDTAESIIARADEALYKAKGNGRNQVQPRAV